MAYISSILDNYSFITSYIKSRLPKTVPSTIISDAGELISGFIDIVIEVSSCHSRPLISTALFQSTQFPEKLVQQ